MYILVKMTYYIPSVIAEFTQVHILNMKCIWHSHFEVNCELVCTTIVLQISNLELWFQANELLIGGRKITAIEACNLGLVSQVFWPTSMMQEVVPKVQNIALSSAKVSSSLRLLWTVGVYLVIERPLLGGVLMMIRGSKISLGIQTCDMVGWACKQAQIATTAGQNLVWMATVRVLI